MTSQLPQNASRSAFDAICDSRRVFQRTRINIAKHPRQHQCQHGFPENQQKSPKRRFSRNCPSPSKTVTPHRCQQSVHSPQSIWVARHSSRHWLCLSAFMAPQRRAQAWPRRRWCVLHHAANFESARLQTHASTHSPQAASPVTRAQCAAPAWTTSLASSRTSWVHQHRAPRI